MSKKHESGEVIEFLSPEEAKSFFENICRERMGMSAQEFVESYNNSSFNCGTDSTIYEILMLLPFWGEPVSEEKGTR